MSGAAEQKRRRAAVESLSQERDALRALLRETLPWLGYSHQPRSPRNVAALNDLVARIEALVGTEVEG